MNDSLIEGLEGAKELLKDKVPVIYAWDAIKAVERAIEYLSIKMSWEGNDGD